MIKSQIIISATIIDRTSQTHDNDVVSFKSLIYSESSISDPFSFSNFFLDLSCNSATSLSWSLDLSSFCLINNAIFSVYSI